MSYTYEYPRPSLTVDLAVFDPGEPRVRVLLVKRGAEPFRGHWALPGGFVEVDEGFEAAARRELGEETGLELVASHPIAFVGVYGDPGRDPRGRTITVAHATILGDAASEVAGGNDAAEAAWHPLDDLPPLAFDHAAILVAARAWLEKTMGRVKKGKAVPPAYAWPFGTGIRG